MSHTFLNLLDSGDYQTYNRSVARTLESVNGAIMLSELVNRYLYHESEDELSTFSDLEGEWFYYTIAACEERTVLSRKEQDSAISVLKKEGLVETAQKSLPAKRYFRLRLKDIEAFVYRLKKLTRMSKRDKQDSPKRANRSDQKGQTISIKNTSKNTTEEHQQQQGAAAAVGETIPKEWRWLVDACGFDTGHVLAMEAVRLKCDPKLLFSCYERSSPRSPAAWLTKAVRGRYDLDESKRTKDATCDSGASKVPSWRSSFTAWVSNLKNERLSVIGDAFSIWPTYMEREAGAEVTTVAIRSEADIKKAAALIKSRLPDIDLDGLPLPC